MNHSQADEVNRLIRIGQRPLAEELIDHYFPMKTGHGNCIRGYECEFLRVCWGTDDPDDHSKFQRRQPNHPRELEVWNER